jgi:phosphoribosylaminoimidazolecarboxamide formyltransferase/IMP cyclohydrolase
MTSSKNTCAPAARSEAMDRVQVKRALISVFDKRGAVELARTLAAAGAEILSTGGTLKALREAGVAAREVADWTGFPEMLDGRVKTLHPKIHGGLLGRRDLPAHRAAMAEHGLGEIDLVAVNLYPFRATVASGAERAQIVEMVDIGGPSMLRSAAKNHSHVTVLCDPDDYAAVAAELRDGGTTLATRRRLAAKAFACTAAYDLAIAQWMTRDEGGGALRYGENPHQAAAVVADVPAAGLGRARALAGGKELSYNNWLDLDGAAGCVHELPVPAAVVVKHTNPCGAATAGSAAEALARAWDGDPLSAFGSVIALNAPFDRACAEFLASGGKFVEVIAAPLFAEDAVTLLRNGPKWGKNVRMLEVPDLGGDAARDQDEARRIWGATLLQTSDASSGYGEELKPAGAVALPAGREADLRLAQTLAKHLKSNSVCLVNDGMLVGAGAGQMSRVDSCRIAIEKAGARARGAVAGSDAFFPFPDGPEALAAAGVVAIVQPGGSVKDAEVTAACDARGVCMLHTGVRHFRH